jgi:hypothetical protein
VELELRIRVLLEEQQPIHLLLMDLVEVAQTALGLVILAAKLAQAGAQMLQIPSQVLQFFMQREAQAQAQAELQELLIVEMVEILEVLLREAVARV